MLEEAYLVQLLSELLFLFWRDVLEGSTVGAEVETYQLHNTLATDDVPTEVADDVDDLLRIIL